MSQYQLTLYRSITVSSGPGENALLTNTNFKEYKQLA